MSGLPHPRFLLFLVVLVGVVAALYVPLGAEHALVLGFDFAAAAFLLTCLPLWREAQSAALRKRAARDDGGRALLLLVAVATLGVVLTALGRMVLGRSGLTGQDVSVVLGTLVLAWIFANTVYAFHYGHLYYDQTKGTDTGGLGFPGTAEPLFADFCYFSFTIGMTTQVSDVVVQTTSLRRVVTLHGLVSFFFNLGVLALVVNVLAGFL